MEYGHINGTRAALVVVDPQRKFFLKRDDWDEIRDRAVSEINRYARLFREHGMPVVFIHFDGPTHEPYPGTDGDEWLQGLEVLENDSIVHKTAMSCFKKTDLEHVLKELGADSIVLCGMLTEYCVCSTYFGAKERDIFATTLPSAMIPFNENGAEAGKIIMNHISDEDLARFLESRSDRS